MPLFTRPHPDAEISRSRRALIEFSMALGGFAIGISEFSPMGLMTDIANDVNISEFQVGHLISAYALGVMVGAPLLAIAGARLLRHQLLILLMGLFAVGNIASAIAADYDLLLLCRFIAGMPHGAYFGVIALVASSLAPANGRAKAVSRDRGNQPVIVLVHGQCARVEDHGLGAGRGHAQAIGATIHID